MKFFVIGSNSFSGSNFIKHLLKKDYEVIGVSRSEEIHNIFLPYKWRKENKNQNFKNKFSFYQIDLNKDLIKLMELIDDFRPEFVINFAAQGMVAESWLNPSHWYKTNLLSQVTFHDELRKRTFLKKYIHISTPEVYGNTSKWISENNNFSPSTPYAVSRAACDLHLLSFFKTYKFPVIFTRAANVYGPGQQLYRIIPRTILSALTERKMKLHGGGNSTRSFIHINDVVNATLTLALKGQPGNTWHISTNEVISIKSLVQLICEMLNKRFEDIVDVDEERMGKDQNYFLNSQSLRTNFSWNDNIQLKDGINETINWVQLNLEKMINLNWDYIHKI